MLRISFIVTVLLALAPLPIPANTQRPVTVCPRDVSFWVDQCKGHSADICKEGMKGLARLVITNSKLRRWQDDHDFKTAESLALLSNADLLKALSDQLHDLDDTRDRAEAEYLALLFNVEVGALPLETTISHSGPETIADLVKAFENDLDRNQNLDTWQQIMERVNEGHIDAPKCPDADQIFRHVYPCGD